MSPTGMSPTASAMRLFVAIYPPPEALDHLAAQVDRLRISQAAATGVNVRLAAREKQHLTVAFLGDVDGARLPDVASALERAAGGWRGVHPPGRSRPGTTSPASDRAAPPRLQLGGGGRFGRGAFTVLWVGVRGDLTALHALHTAVRRELRRARLPYDRRPYRPHLTLARPGDRVERSWVDADRDTLNDYLGPFWPVPGMVLVRSELGPNPRYHELGAWPV